MTVAQNPFAPEDVLMKLATDGEFRIRLAVAKNPNASAEVLAVLAEESLRLMQVAVAEHPNIGEETLHRLFTRYKSEIEKRKDLPVSILERFYREEATSSHHTRGNINSSCKFRFLVGKICCCTKLINIFRNLFKTCS